MLLGMGADGHMASLFPGSPAVREKERLVVGPFVEKLGAHRITITPPVFAHARESGARRCATRGQVNGQTTAVLDFSQLYEAHAGYVHRFDVAVVPEVYRRNAPRRRDRAPGCPLTR